MLFNSDDSACFLCGLDNNIAVDGLDGVDVDKTNISALFLKLLNCLTSLVNNKTCCNYGNLVTLV